jgi:molecular chaperone GrpE
MMNTEQQTMNNEHGLMAHVRRRIDEQAALAARLDAIEQQIANVGAVVGQIAERSSRTDDPAVRSELAALREALAALEKQIGRAGREQFKANVLAETQTTQLTAALEALRAADERREATLIAAHDRQQEAQADARMDVIRTILPALDGLDEALRSGEQVLAQYHDRRTATVEPHSGDGQPGQPPREQADGGRWSVLRWLRARVSPAQADVEPQVNIESQASATLPAALDAWLVGLTFVRQRLLDVLSSAGVVPIKAAGQPFDPRYHVAVASVPAAEQLPDTVAQELRRGYLAGERVLRHAEVAVATGKRATTNDE